MIIVMQPGAAESDLDTVVAKVQAAGLGTHVIVGVTRSVVGVVGDDRTKEMLRESLEVSPGVERVVAILQPYKLVSREFIGHDTIVRVNGTEIGSAKVAVMAGPCSVETRDQLLA